MELDEGLKVGIFLSDIAGAFDRVDTELLLEKLKRCGLSDKMLGFLNSYLVERKAVVIVNGTKSDEFDLRDIVYQGTVLGPVLWLVFFADVLYPSESTGCVAAKFADDLNTYKTYDEKTEN